MKDYQHDFVNFLLETGALKVGGPGTYFGLKSGRLSPHFVNIGDFNDSVTTPKLGSAYAAAIADSGQAVDIVYGIPEKGVGLAIATSLGFGSVGRNVPWAFMRKDPKAYGEATALPPEQRAKKLVLGRVPQSGQRIALLDDVFTTGDTKYDTVGKLKEILTNPDYTGLFIGVDRQELAPNGTSAIAKFREETGIPVFSIVSAVQIYTYLKEISAVRLPAVLGEIGEYEAEIRRLEERPAERADAGVHRELAHNRTQLQRLQTMSETLDPANIERIATYLRLYGTDEARAAVGKIREQRLIGADRSVVPACDVETIEQFEAIMRGTAGVQGIEAYKVGFDLGLGHGLPRIVERAKELSGGTARIIYDHQKGGTDIPDTGKNFARRMKKSGVDAAILFPQSGPETERAWIFHLLEQEVNVIVGGRMTHPAYAVSEGGWITDEGALQMYLIAASAGVNHFIVPGNKPDAIRQIREAVEAEGVDPVFLAPGFIAQGGKIADAARAAGRRFHGIVGRGITEAKDILAAAAEYTSQLYAE